MLNFRINYFGGKNTNSFCIFVAMIKTFYFNELRTCCYILWDETNEAVIIDPGCISESEKGRLVKFIDENNLSLKMLLNTHGHFDHVMGNVFITQTYNIPTYMNKDDIAQVKRASSYGSYFGIEIPQPSLEVEDLKDGDIIKFGNSELKVSTTPGHSQGGVIFYWDKEKAVFTGDCLFAGSIGRTDLPGGDLDLLKDSLKNKILSLPAETEVYPGHGPKTSIAYEIGSNPFLDF